MLKRILERWEAAEIPLLAITYKTAVGSVHPYTVDTASSYPVARSPRVEAGHLHASVMLAVAFPGPVNAFMA
jgi:hypothetical protein